jgi:hypothetical protein
MKITNTLDFKAIYEEALAEGQAAYEAFYSKHGEPFYCGFAWVEIPDGRSPFVRWCKANNIGDKHWKKGWSIWNPVGSMTQSMYLKEVASDAFAAVLRKHGIVAWMHSRAD